MALTLVGPILGLVPGIPGGGAAAYGITAAAVLTGPGSNGITAITQATYAVVTISTVSAANPFAVGASITFAGVVGMTQMNGLTGVVVAIGGSSGAWTVTTSINSTAFTAYASGGTCFNINPSVLCLVTCQVSGSITLNDSNTLAAAAITNQIIAWTATAGQFMLLNWPCALGITASGVSSGTFSLTFS